MPILELWASPPGTGKTRACIELFRESLLTSKAGIESRSFFILPSREHAERIQHLVLKTGIPGLFNAHILTVNDFTARSLGFSSGRRPTDAVRRFILKEILEGTDWKCFAEVKDTKGFLRLLMDTLKEFKAGLLTVEEFERRAQPLLKDPVFRSKFRDISVVWKNYEQSLESLGLKESEDEIAQLVLRRQKASLDLVIFDGFYHFTRAQERLMEWMASSARRMVVTLTLPSDAYRRGLFGYPARTREALRRIGFKEGKNFPRGNLRASRGALRHLEENVFAERPRLYRGDDETAIHIQEASSEEQEMELVAREIRRLYRESPLHYADVCVILRSLSGREKVMESVFRRFGIPFFIHERKKLIEHGFTATLSRFLDVFLEGWRREDLLFVLKSSYLAEAVSFEAAAELETASFRRSVREGKEAWLGLLDLGDVSSPAKALLRFVREWEERFLSSKGAGEFERNVFLLLRSFAMGGEEAG
ncbi:MAG: exodeoxyribonuclease V subunit gamma, partial [Candidatus Omnitrophica bacterium]|nr:exodeoxyribonuclease V subunit gamma [Candidatus Omnitrophota bacterium]